MITTRDASARTRPSFVFTCSILAGALLALAPSVSAQDTAPAPPPNETRASLETQTFFLRNATERGEVAEAETNLRMMLPRDTTVYANTSEAAISVKGPAADLAKAQKLIQELDKPRTFYRITYTINETDAGKPTAPQHITLVVASGIKAVFKEGSRVPIITGSSSNESPSVSTQVQYLDVGLNLDATLDVAGDAPRLRTMLEQSSVSDEKSAAVQDPIIRQTKLETTTTLKPGKPQIIGSIDIPGSTRHAEIEVSSELIR